MTPSSNATVAGAAKTAAAAASAAPATASDPLVKTAVEPAEVTVEHGHDVLVKPPGNDPNRASVRISVDARGWALGILATVAVVFALEAASVFFISLLTGIVLAFILNPMVNWLERWHVRRGIGTTLVMATLTAGAIGGLYALRQPMESLLDAVPAIVQKISSTLNSSDGSSAFTRIQRAVGEVQKVAQGVPAGQPPPAATPATASRPAGSATAPSSAARSSPPAAAAPARAATPAAATASGAAPASGAVPTPAQQDAPAPAETDSGTANTADPAATATPPGAAASATTAAAPAPTSTTSPPNAPSNAHADSSEASNDSQQLPAQVQSTGSRTAAPNAESATTTGTSDVASAPAPARTATSSRPRIRTSAANDANAHRASTAPAPQNDAHAGQPEIRFGNFLLTGSLGILGFIGQASMVGFLVFFLLVAGDTFKRKMVKLTGPTLTQKKITVQILDDINQSVQRYMLVLFVTNLTVGALTYGLLLVLGFDNALGLAVAAGLLHVIPYLGPAVTAVILAAAGTLQTDQVATGLIAAGGSLAIATVVGMLVTTWMTGRIARMNATAVFVALLFWGWLWGAWGLLLGIPIIVIIKVISEHIEQLEPLSELLGE